MKDYDPDDRLSDEVSLHCFHPCVGVCARACLCTGACVRLRVCLPVCLYGCVFVCVCARAPACMPDGEKNPHLKIPGFYGMMNSDAWAKTSAAGPLTWLPVCWWSCLDRVMKELPLDYWEINGLLPTEQNRG